MICKVQEVEARPFFKLLKVRGYNRVCFSHYNIVDVEIVDEIVKAITDRDQALQLKQTVVSRSFLSEDDLVELGFSKNLMAGTGWLTTNSMRDAVYYYKKGRITINATEFWTWFLDNEQRNDIAVSSKDALSELLQNYG